MRVRTHEGYVSFDGTGDNGWGRVFAVVMPDKSAGLLIAEHLTEPHPVFDYKTEMNLGIACGASVEHALSLKDGDPTPVYPAIIRRLARLMTHGSMIDSFHEVMIERGLERMVVYGEKMSHQSYSIFDRAGFAKEKRGEIECRVLELPDVKNDNQLLRTF